MKNQQLIDYVQKELARGVSKEDIERTAVAGGWSAMDVADALGTPLVPTAPIKYAGFWIRFVALMVDSVILFLPSLIFSSFLGFITIALGLSGNMGFSIFQSFLSMILYWVYFILMTHYVGATLGKMLVGITVRSDVNGKLSLGRVILRETIGRLASVIIIFIGYIMVAFTPKKQALHDMIAHSVVIYKDPAHPNKTGIIIGTIIAVIIPGIALLGIISSIVLVSLSVARQKGFQAQMKYNTSVSSSSTGSSYTLPMPPVTK